MDIEGSIAMLYEKDTSQAYRCLRELEALSEQQDSVYRYMDEFIAMLDSGKYVVRVRGFRLLCKQARWDAQGKIDRAADKILAAVDDEKPTAVRQKLQALQGVVPYKRALHGPIRRMAATLDYTRFRDTMQPLIAKDIAALVRCMDAAGPAGE